jgi:hypothetical protein
MNALKEKVKEREILRNIKRFVSKQFPDLGREDKEIKLKEILIGFEGYESIRKKNFVVVRLPEGVTVVINDKGNFYDFDEFFFLRR